MAAILTSSRCIPRHLCRISTNNVKTASKQISAQTRSKHVLPNARNTRPLVAAKALTQSNSSALCERQILLEQSRSFRATSVVCDDVQTVLSPPFADSITEGDIRWEKAVGDTVSEDEVVAEIETDKTSIPVPSPGAGVIEEFLVEDGDTVVAKTPLFKIRMGGAGDAPAPKAVEVPSPAASAPPPAAPAPAASVGPIPTTPPPPPPMPTAPMSSTPTSAVKPTPRSDEGPAPSIPGLRSETRVKMNRMRLRIAERLKEAQNSCAMLTTFNEVDMTNIMEMRKTYKDAFMKKHNIKLGFMSAFLKASAVALKEQPSVNAVIDNKEIVYRDYVDISVAVATPKGLVVPVLRDLDNLNYAEIEQALNEIGEKARGGNLAIEDMDGGTFTISNGGVFGSMFGTPIINPPQSAILGMHAIFNRPMAVDGKVEIRPMMYIALTYDHRLIDGREAVTFLKRIKSGVEDPRTLLLDI
ncbi:unnamed protein product [Owenia fusiformis]|uniref:Dihydrolipoyllysine-residue succinyltransferase component of 2-oxoglutarate dehydrogenase complex, mitochondrial n=1 Tax=Owenia fusiformis TaxID=6347 RepID=A0A8S4P909_OWEFU|nr:unnamed protein product [Owenia fusiformis]